MGRGNRGKGKGEWEKGEVMMGEEWLISFGSRSWFIS